MTFRCVVFGDSNRWQVKRSAYVCHWTMPLKDVSAVLAQPQSARSSSTRAVILTCRRKRFQTRFMTLYAALQR